MVFVTFEGIDGCGKSTQARLLLERLQRSGSEAILFREPGGTALSERIRSLLLDPELNIHAFPELLLFSSARAQLVEEQIRPSMEKGTVVICDRFFDSTTAYQGAGRENVDRAWLRDFNMRVTAGLRPDRTYLIALEPAAARRRARGRQDEMNPDSDDINLDRMERNDRSFFQRVADGYDQIAREEPDRILRLDGSRSIEELSETIWNDFQNVLARTKGTAPSA